MASAHTELFIVKGIAPAVGDTNSAEVGLTSLNLISADGDPGLTIDPAQDWQPQRAQLKNGGVWTESAVSDGRQLLAAQRGNVVETINLVGTAATWQLAATQLVNLQRLALDAENFWTTQYQIEPVYLQWWAKGAPGRQYALIYDIQIAHSTLDYANIGQQAHMQVTLTIEREAFWRGIAPGDNPLVWTFSGLQKKTPGLQYNVSNLSLVAGTDHLAYQAISNRAELTAPNANSFLSQNFIDIPASKIPGDAPALTCLVIENQYSAPAGVFTKNIYIGKSTKPTSYTARLAGAPTQRVQTGILNAGDSLLSTIGGVGAKVVDAVRGVLSNSSLVNKYVAQYAFGAGAVAKSSALTWSQAGGPWYINDLNALRGRYMVFVRCSQTAGAQGDFILALDVSMANDTASTVVTQSLPDATALLVDATNCGLTYMGTITIPFTERSASSVSGYGLEVAPANQPNLIFSLYITKVLAGTARTLIISDLILIPVDECSVQLVPNVSVAGSRSYFTLLDNTGYFAHGQPQPIGLKWQDTNPANLGSYAGMDIEVRGPDLTLTPGVNNRLYFIKDDGTAPTSLPVNTMNIRVNIVPRWGGARDA